MKPKHRLFSRSVFISLFLATADLVLLACTTFGPVNPREYVVSSRPQQIWVWKADSSVVLMRGPHFLAGSDTLVGVVEGAYQEIPLSSIQQVKANRRAPLKTAAVVIGGMAFVVSGAVLIKKSKAPPETNCMSDPECGCDLSCKYP